MQVLLTYPASSANFFPAARISNCVFDLRHQLALPETAGATLSGPFFGIMMQRPSTVDNGVSPAYVGYLDGRTLIAHNSFIFARWTGEEGNGGWETESRNSTVGIIDFTVSLCSSTLVDGNDTHRGVGNSCIVSNLFRTRPLAAGTSTRPFAMLGIGGEDTQVLDGGVYVNTNAFDPARVGSTNGAFHSVPVQSFVASVNSTNWEHWNCQFTLELSPCNSSSGTTPACTNTSPLPAPKVALWDTVAGVDPGFVGEYVASVLATPTDSDYVDWRLMPSSPLENQSVSPAPGGPRGFVTQPHAGDVKWIFSTETPSECALFQWDGEHWGNPRIADGAPDIGFDERGLVIQAGNWANGSNSHNQPGFMQPTGTGSTTRWFILPLSAGGVTLNAANRYLRLHDTTQVPAGGVPGDAWINPPATLSIPPSLGSLPVGYRTKYISFANSTWAPLALQFALDVWQPLTGTTGQSLGFLRMSLVDDECLGSGGCLHAYFNLQGVIVDSPSSATELLRSNLQSEYR